MLQNKVKIFLFTILLGLNFCAYSDNPMKFDDVHIGGKEVNPVTLRMYGDENLAQKYIGIARLQLGEMKREMQLSIINPDIVQHKSKIKKLPDNTVIKTASIFGIGEQADIDEIWIDVRQSFETIASITPTTTPTTGKPSKVVAFSVHLKFHNDQASAILANGSSTPYPQEINYFISEPYLTSGYSLQISTEETLAGPSQYSEALRIIDTAVSSPGFDGDSKSYTEKVFIEDSFSEAIVSEAMTNYSLYTETNIGFDSVNTGYAYSDGYLGKFECRLDKSINDLVVLSDYIDFFVPISGGYYYYEPPYTVVITTLTVDKGIEFIPGRYGIGAAIHAAFFGASAIHFADFGGFTIVVTRADGSEKEFDFDFTISSGIGQNEVSSTVVMFDPINGKIEEYNLTHDQNPFYKDTGNPSNPNTWSPVLLKEIDPSIKPVRTIDVTI